MEPIDIDVTPEEFMRVAMAEEAALFAELKAGDPDTAKMLEDAGYGPEPRSEPTRVDVGPYCTECREDTTGQEKRTPSTREAVQIVRDPETGEAKDAETILLAGWLCESCQPFGNTMIEEMCKSLIERNFDARTVRRAMREIGEEAIWERWFGPMLDTAEVTLGLEYR